MAYPLFQSYHPFGTLTAASSPMSTYSGESLGMYRRPSLNMSSEDISDDNIKHVSEDEYEAMIENPLWPSVFAPAKVSETSPPCDLSGYTSTVPWAIQSFTEQPMARVPSIVSTGSRRESAGVSPRRSSLSRTWGPDTSPEGPRRASVSSMVDYGASSPQSRMLLARSLGQGRSTSLLAQAARRRSSAVSSGSKNGSLVSYDPEEAEQVRRIRSMDLLGRRFSEAVYVEPEEPGSPESSSSEEEEERDWTPDLHSKVNIWSPDSSADLSDDDDSEVQSLPALATPEFRPIIAELSNFPLASFATMVSSLNPSPSLGYAAGGVGGVRIGETGPTREWQLPLGTRQQVPPSEYLHPALPAPVASASLRIGSTIGPSSPPILQSSFRRSASSPLFGARNGDMEAFSKPRADRDKKSSSLRTIIPMASGSINGTTARAQMRPSLNRVLSDCKEELQMDLSPSPPKVQLSGGVSRQASCADEVRQFEFLAAEITLQESTPAPVPALTDYAFPGPSTPKAPVRPASGICRNFAPTHCVLPGLAITGWSSLANTPGSVTPRYNPLDSFLGISSPASSLHPAPAAQSDDTGAMPPPPTVSLRTSPAILVEPRYKDEAVQTGSPARRVRPRSSDVGVYPPVSTSPRVSPPRFSRPRSGGLAISHDNLPTAIPVVTSGAPKSPSSQQQPRITRSVTEPYLASSDTHSPGKRVIRKAVPTYPTNSPTLPVLGSPVSEEHGTQANVIGKRRSHKHTKKCRRCEEKAMLRLLAERTKQAMEAAAARAQMSPSDLRSSPALEGKSDGDPHCSCCAHRSPGAGTHSAQHDAGHPLSAELDGRDRKGQFAGLFPDPPMREAAAPSASLVEEAPPLLAPMPHHRESPASPPQEAPRVTYARTPSPKRHKQALRSLKGDLAMHTGVVSHISAPVLISSTSNRNEIPLALRGWPLSAAMLSEVTPSVPEAALRPRVRHPGTASGSFPQDFSAAALNPNAPLVTAPRPDLRRAASAMEPTGSGSKAPGHLSKKPSIGLFKFLHNLPGHSKHEEDTLQTPHRSPASPASSSISGGSGDSPNLIDGAKVFRKGHTHSSSSVSSSATMVSNGRSRPTSTGSNASERTIVDLKESFKLFAASAKGGKVVQEEAEEAGFEDGIEILHEDKTSRLSGGAGRRPGIYRHTSWFG